MKYLKIAGTVALAATASMILTSCGKESPSDALGKAITNQSKVTSETVTMHLAADPSNFSQLVKDLTDSDSSTADKEKSLKAINSLLSTSLVFAGETTNGKPLAEADSKNLDFAVTLKNKDTDLFNVLNTKNNFFVKGDLKAFGNLTGLYTGDELNKVKSEYSSSGVSSDDHFKWVSSFIDGKWLGFDSSVFDFAKNNEIINDQNITVNGKKLTAEQGRVLATDIKNEVTSQSTYSWDDDSIKMEVPIKKLLPSVKADVEKITGKSLAGDELDSYNQSLKALTDVPFTVFYKVDNDQLKQVRFDIAQVSKIINPSAVDSTVGKDTLAKFGKYSLPLVFDFEQSANIAAPKDYVKVDKSDLNGLFFSPSSDSYDETSGDDYGSGSETAPAVPSDDNSYSNEMPELPDGTITTAGTDGNGTVSSDGTVTEGNSGSGATIIPPVGSTIQ